MTTPEDERLRSRARGAAQADQDRDLLGRHLDPDRAYSDKCFDWRRGYAERASTTRVARPSRRSAPSPRNR